MDILLMLPPAASRTKRASNASEPSLGLGYIAAYMSARGFDVKQMDCHAENIPLNKMVEYVRANQPRIVGMSAATVHVYETAAAAAAIKEALPNTTVVVGGYHTTALPGETLAEYPQFDFTVAGEGETTFHELTQAVLGGNGDFNEINGVAFRDSDGVRVAPPRAPIMDLDTMPFPQWELFNLKAYHPHYDFGLSGRPLELPVSTSRGCPDNCVFCSRAGGSVFRKRSAPNVLAEIRRDVEQFNARLILFASETFSADTRFIRDLCNGLIGEGLNKKIEWLCETRVDRVDRDLLQTMKDAGCVHVSFGLESGSQEILDKATKGITLDQSRAAVAAAKAIGLQTDLYMILGLPYENAKTINQTIRFVMELDPDFVNYFVAVPFPGTRMLEMAKRGEGGLVLLEKDWTKYNFIMGNAMALESVPLTRLKLLQLKAYLMFYLRPKRLPNFLRMIKLRAIPVYFYYLMKSFMASKKMEREA